MSVFFLTTFLSGADQAANTMFTKMLPNGAKVRAEVRIEDYEHKTDFEFEAKMKEKGFQFQEFKGKAEINAMYFTCKPGDEEVLVQKFLVKLVGEDKFLAGDEPLYLKGFRILDAAQAKDRLIVVVQNHGHVELIAFALDKSGNVTKKHANSIIIPTRWERRNEGFLPIKSAHLIALPDRTSILFVSDEGHRMFWDVSNNAATLVWTQKDGDPPPAQPPTPTK
jgi:hypothetical protein